MRYLLIILVPYIVALSVILYCQEPKQKVVVFTAEWCGSCAEEIEKYNRMFDVVDTIDVDSSTYKAIINDIRYVPNYTALE